MRSVLTLFITIIFTIEFCSAQNFTLQDTSFTEGEILVTYNVKFNLGKSTFKPETYLYLDTIVLFLNRHNKLIIEVGNHLDERWSAESSRCLTCNRAEEVVNYLISKGIDSKRLVSVGYNDLNPIIKNATTEDEHLVNRRTEFKILRTDFEE